MPEMKRVPEPEIMGNLSQAKAYAEADFSLSDESVIDELQKYLLRIGRRLDSESVIIDLGCGPGNIAERVARCWPMARVVGIDGSKAMLDIAITRRNKVCSSEDIRGITYLCLDIGSIADGSIDLGMKADLVISNSVLHHFHDPIQFWKAIKNISGVGAVSLHRDLRRPSSIKKALAMQRRYLSNAPAILIDDYLASLHAAFTIDEVKTQLQFVGLEKFHVLEIEDRYLDVFGTI